MEGMVARHGSYKDVGFVHKDLYNMCSTQKRKMLEKGDANTAIGMMLSRKKRDPGFFFEYQLDENGNLQTMFWCDSQSRQDYQDFGDVVVFDSTYKMNRYRMPFVPFVGLNSHRKTTVFGCAIVSNETEETYAWVLESFMRAMGQKKPKSVITDGDAAMIAAIRRVLTGVRHRLCSWHIEKNMQEHLCSDACPEFRSLVYYPTEHAVFEQRWHTFVAKWETKYTGE